MKSVTMPTLLQIGEATASPYAKQSIEVLQRSLPNPTLVVLENHEHNPMEAGCAARQRDRQVRVSQAVRAGVAEFLGRLHLPPELYA